MVSYSHIATNTGTETDQNCIGLHAPTIPFPTYQKKFLVCFLKLCNAQYLMTKPCNSSRAPQTNHRMPETWIPMGITSPSPFLYLLHPTIHLNRWWLSVLPKETSRTPRKICALSLRVRLLVLTLFLSPQNDSVPIASHFDSLLQ